MSKPLNPLGTGCKLNIHKTFKRRPGRLLNVLCTFNLRPVSRGNGDLNNAFISEQSKLTLLEVPWIL